MIKNLTIYASELNLELQKDYDIYQWSTEEDIFKFKWNVVYVYTKDSRFVYYNWKFYHSMNFLTEDNIAIIKFIINGIEMDVTLECSRLSRSI
jgi:hypothetical protein